MPKKNRDKTVSRVVGAGAGAVGGAAAGAAVGSVVPGVGTAVGAVVGGVGGALAGTGISYAVDPDEEAAYWEQEFPNRPYHDADATFEEYWPAYRYGIEAVQKYPGEKFDKVESRLGRAWPKARGKSALTWSKARDAAHDSFDRTIRLHEEQLQVDKDRVETGQVAVKKVNVSERKLIDVPVEREEVVITRKPARGAGRKGALAEAPQEIRIPIKEEQVKVTKRTVPIEEVSVGRRKVKDVHHVDETIRKEEIRTEKSGKARVRNQSGAAGKR
jgi:uncharacterized protein (TIGR02271 family)